MIVQVKWGASWYPATIVSTAGDSVSVHYNGWSENFDETVPRSNIAFAPPEVPQPPGVTE